MSTEDLFGVEVGRQLSPRLEWIAKHGIVTYRSQPENWPVCWYAGFQEWRPELKDEFDFFGVETAENGDSRVGTGDTEDEALADLATKAGLRLWNELVA